MADIVKFYKERHKNDNGWYLVPRAQYFNEANLGEWHTILQYLSDQQYITKKELKHYQPNLGQDVSAEERFLREWTQDEQLKLFDWMKAKGIIQPFAKGQSINDQLANVRNYLNLLKKLGFGFVNSEKHLFISPVGEKFLNSSSIAEWETILQKQLIRIQLWNPSLAPNSWRKYRAYRIFPYLFTLEILLLLEPQYITSNEFCRILAFAHKMDEVDFISELIMDYRTLPIKDAAEVDRTSKLSFPQKANGAVHMELFGLTPSLSYKDAKLYLTDEAYAKSLINIYEPKLTYVVFDDFTDWYQTISEEEPGIDIVDILKYYIETGKEEEAETILHEKAKVSKPSELKSFEELLSDLLLEKSIEDILEKTPSILEKNLKLIPNGRQFPTEVGRIDLLAKDGTNKYVVIELKKDRVEDKVVGQILRYMGWVRANLSPTEDVRGIIAGSDLTQKVKMAMLGLQMEQPLITLKQLNFDVKAKIIDVSPS